MGLTKTNGTSAEKMMTLVADKMKVGFILFYSICQYYRYKILNPYIFGLNSTKKEGKCLLN